MNKLPMNKKTFSAKRLVILALVALLGIALPIYSLTRACLKARAISALRLNYPQKQPAAVAPQRSGSECPRDPICCACHCC